MYPHKYSQNYAPCRNIPIDLDERAKQLAWHIVTKYHASLGIINHTMVIIWLTTRLLLGNKLGFYSSKVRCHSVDCSRYLHSLIPTTYVGVNFQSNQMLLNTSIFHEERKISYILHMFRVTRPFGKLIGKLTGFLLSILTTVQNLRIVAAFPIAEHTFYHNSEKKHHVRSPWGVLETNARVCEVVIDLTAHIIRRKCRSQFFTYCFMCWKNLSRFFQHIKQ